LGIQNGERTSSSYAWIVLAVLFVGHIAAFGVRASFGVYIAPWEQDFSIGRSIVSAISMVSFIVFAVGQPLAGKLNDRIGKGIIPIIGVFLMGGSLVLMSQAGQIWQIFLLFGVLFSLGYAACSSSIAAVIITHWFVKNRGLAMGIVMAGLAVGQLILVPASLLMVEQVGWRSTVTILGLLTIVIVGVLFIIFVRSRPEEKGLKPYGYDGPADDILPEKERELPVLSILKLPIFWQISIPYFICGFTDSGIVQTHLIPIADGKGLSLSIVAIAFVLIAIANIAGTILTGHLSDHFSRTKQLAIIYIVRALTFVMLIALHQPWVFLFFAVVYGFVEMASIAPTNSLTVQIFDGYSRGVILGLIVVSHHIGGAVGSWIPGLLYDLTGSYNSILILSIVMLLIGSLVALKTPENSGKLQFQ